MPRRQLVPIVSVLALLGAGCREQKASVAADTSAGAVRANAVNAMASKGFEMPVATAGHLTLVDGEIFFLPCGRTGDPQKLDDATGGEAIRMLPGAKGQTGGVMTLVRLDGNRLLQVRYASAERMTCKDFPSNATVDARGNEPFWAVRIEGDLATYRTPDNLQGIVFQGGKWTRVDSTHWRFVARREGKGANEMTLELQEIRCADSMAESVFPMSVKVTRGDSTNTGCALEGLASFAGHADAKPLRFEP